MVWLGLHSYPNQTIGRKNMNFNKPVPRIGQIVLKTVFAMVTLVGLTLVGLGMGSTWKTYLRGVVGIITTAAEDGQGIWLTARSGGAATEAGIETGDMLAAIDGQAAPQTVEETYEALSGRVGEAVTLRVRKADGSEKDYTVVRTSHFPKLGEAGLTLEVYSAFFIVAAALAAAAFVALSLYAGGFRFANWYMTAGVFMLLLMPYSLNAATVAADGAWVWGVYWIHVLIRAAGLGLLALMLFIFPTGQLTPAWTKWAALAMAVWMAPFLADQLGWISLPGWLVDWVWIAIFATGALALGLRYRQAEAAASGQIRELLGPGLAVLALYALTLVINGQSPADTLLMSGGWLWYKMISVLVQTAAIVYFGWTFARLLRQTAK
jgi:hypothetical protein